MYRTDTWGRIAKIRRVEQKGKSRRFSGKRRSLPTGGIGRVTGAPPILIRPVDRTTSLVDGPVTRSAVAPGSAARPTEMRRETPPWWIAAQRPTVEVAGLPQVTQLMGRGVEALHPVGRPITTNRRPSRRCDPVVNCHPVVGLSRPAVARSNPAVSLSGLLVSRRGPPVSRRARLSLSAQLSLNLSGRGNHRPRAVSRRARTSRRDSTSRPDRHPDGLTRTRTAPRVMAMTAPRSDRACSARVPVPPACFRAAHRRRRLTIRGNSRPTTRADAPPVVATPPSPVTGVVVVVALRGGRSPGSLTIPAGIATAGPGGSRRGS
jgi:hypothetical protein